jgi:hypothetical protein
MFTIIIWCYSVLNFGTTPCVSSENLVRGYVLMDLRLIARPVCSRLSYGVATCASVRAIIRSHHSVKCLLFCMAMEATKLLIFLSWRKREKFTSVFVVGIKPPEAGSFILYKPLFLYYFLFFQCTEKWTPSQKDLVIVTYLGTNPMCLWWELDNIELHVAGVTGWCLRHCHLTPRYLPVTARD